jgi:hypothetical protein
MVVVMELKIVKLLGKIFINSKQNNDLCEFEHELEQASLYKMIEID